MPDLTNDKEKEMAQLIVDLMEVVTDFLPNIGQCCLQDYWLLNDAMYRAERFARQHPEIKKSKLEETPPHA